MGNFEKLPEKINLVTGIRRRSQNFYNLHLEIDLQPSFLIVKYDIMTLGGF